MSTDRQNPYASPTEPGGPNTLRRVGMDAVPAEPPMGLINVVEQAAKPPRAWRMAFGADEAWLYMPDEHSAFVLTHAELAEHANMMPWGPFLMLAMRGMVPDGRAIAFKVEGDAIAVFRRWAFTKRDLILAAVLKKRLRYSLPLGIFISALALPILGDGVQPLSLIFGVGIALLALIAPRKPHPFVFVIESVLWLCYGGGSVLHAVNSGSKLSIFFALMCLFFARQSFRTYSFYR